MFVAPRTDVPPKSVEAERMGSKPPEGWTGLAERLIFHMHRERLSYCPKNCAQFVRIQASPDERHDSIWRHRSQPSLARVDNSIGYRSQLRKVMPRR